VVNRAQARLSLNGHEAAKLQELDRPFDGAFGEARVDCDSLPVGDYVREPPNQGDVDRLNGSPAVERFKVTQRRKDLVINRGPKSLFGREAKIGSGES
jgi:hypothetical protein